MAKFKVAAVFSSNMVLQREKNIKVFGQGDDGETITVTFLGATYSTTVKNEKWLLTIPPQEAGSGYEMVISCKEERKAFHNIAIGEVWLAGGQSNMELELKDCKDGEELLKEASGKDVRFYYTQKNAYMDEHFYAGEEQSAWKLFGDEGTKHWSAVGYIFANKITKDLGVTVGIIGCNWGGSSASCWMEEEYLRKDEDLNTYLTDYAASVSGKTEEEQIREYKEYEAYRVEWEKKCNALYAENPKITWNEVLSICGDSKWPGPPSCINPYRPCGLYECMVQRILPYTLRGFIYYQGESDDHKPEMYQKLLTALIANWRSAWEDLTLPFLIVQLPMHRYEADPDFKKWCLIREAQMNTFQTIRNTGIAVILDSGEFNEIHPKNKKPVGERLALQALYHVYLKGSAQESFGPVFKSYSYKDDGIELCFDYAENGFDIKGEITGFEIAGEDGHYVKADPTIHGSRIYLSSSEIKKPLYARYCWTNYGDVTVFGKNGIPLAPFRTCHRDGFRVIR